MVPAGTRKGEAEKLVTELVQRRQQGDDLGSDRATLSAYLTEHWLPIQEARLKPTTYLSYKDMIRLHVTPHIGRIKLSKLQA